MISWSHVGDTAILMALAYILGCAIGFAAYRLSHRAPAKPLEAEAGVVDLAAEIAARLPPMPPAAAIETPATPSDTPDIDASAPTLVTATPPLQTLPPPRPGAPKTLAKPRGGVKDDLKVIKGIGPKLEPQLNALGIFHVAQIALWSRANADWVSRELGFPGRVEREAWVAQAKALTPRQKTKRPDGQKR